MRINAKIYVMRAGDGALKLGHSKNPLKRSKQLNQIVEIVHETDVIEQAEKIELLAHRVLALHGGHIKDEWFRATLDQAIAAIEIATRQAEQQELQLGGKIKRPRSNEMQHMVHIRIGDGMMQALKRVSKSRSDRPPTATLIRELLAESLERRK